MGTRFLSKNERNILRPKLSRFGEIFCFATKPHRLQSPGRPRHLGVIVYSYFMPVCSIVKTITSRCRGLPDALYCTRAKAECNSVSGRPRYRGVIV